MGQAVASGGEVRPGGTRRPRFWPLLGLGLLLVPLAHVTGLLWLIWARSFDVPMFDEWGLVFLVQDADDGTLTFDDFWRYQSVHRIFATRAVSWPVIELTGWHRQVMMTISLVGTVATVALLLAAVSRTLGLGRWVAPIAAVLSLLFLSFGQARVWLQPFLIAFVLAALGIAITTWSLLQRRSRRWAFALAVAGAILTSLSFLTGLFAWLVFVPAVWTQGRRRLAVWSAAAVVVVVPYLIGFPASYATNGGVASLGDATSGVLGYGLAYLGASITNDDLDRARFFGALGIALAGGNLLLLRGRRTRLVPVLPWLGVAAFVLLTAAITFLGRSELGTRQPLAHRYQPIQSLWWVAVGVVSLLAIAAARDRRARRDRGRTGIDRLVLGANGLAALLILAGAVVNDRNGYGRAAAWLDQGRLNQPCARAFDHASDDCLAFFTIPDYFRLYGPYLRERRMAMFRDGVETDFAALPAGSEPGLGAILGVGSTRFRPERTRPIDLPADEPATILGWALDPATGETGGGVLIVVDDRAPIFALAGEPTPRVANDAAAAGREAGFVATLPAALLPPGRHSLSVRVLSADRRSYAELPQRLELVVGAATDGEDAADPPTSATPAGTPAPRTASGGRTASPTAGEPDATPRAERRRRRDEPRPTREGGRRRRAENSAPVASSPAPATGSPSDESPPDS